MNIALDISTLGMGFYHEKSRTGVFRVVEQLAIGLQKEPDLNLFYACEDNLPDSLLMLNELKPSTQYDFLHSQTQIRSAKFKNAIYQLFPKNSIPQKGLRKIFHTISGYNSLLDENKFSKIDIFHSPYLPFSAQVLANNSVKKIMTIHDLIPIKFPHFFEEGHTKILQETIKSIPKDGFVTCVSEATKNDFCEITNFNPERVFVQYLAASTDFFYKVEDPTAVKNVLKQYKIPSETPYLLSLSTLEPRKNIHTTIKAFIELIENENITDFNLVLVGTKGWKFEQIFEEMKMSEKIRSRIFITGFVADKDLAAIYSGALGFTYLSHYEGFGLPPLEAMQCGIPVISSNTSSLPEVVGDAGILVNPNDIEAIKEAIFSIFQDSTLRNELSIKALKRASLFSWENFSHQTKEMYFKIR
jgi:glycosyltransferase involved in cell wall biosynthesis